MRKDLIVPIVFVVIIIGAVIAGILHHNMGHPASNSATTNTITVNSKTGTTESTDSLTSTSTMAPVNSASETRTNAEYFIYYGLVFNKTANTTISFVNGTYFIALNGVMNYPPVYLNPGNYTLIYIETSVSFPNGTTKYFVIPVYQQIAIKNNDPTKFYIILEGNSPALYTLYNIIEYLLGQGIDSVQVTFMLLQNNEYTYQVEGVLNL